MTSMYAASVHNVIQPLDVLQVILHTSCSYWPALSFMGLSREVAKPDHKQLCSPPKSH